MSADKNRGTNESSNAFSEQADAGRSGLLAEFWEFLAHNGKWWMLPILLLMVALGALVALTATGAAPFIYTLF